MATRAELRRLGKSGFSEEDYAEWLRQGVVRREDVQAHKMELEKLREFGAGERQRAGFGFQRPEQTARIGEIGTRTAREKFRLGFEEDLKKTMSNIIGQRKTLGGLDIKVLRKQLEGLTAKPTPKPAPTVEVAAPEARPTARVAKPRRKLRPSAEKFLWSGYPERGLPGLGAPLKGWMDIGEILRRGMGKAGRWLFPETR